MSKEYKVTTNHGLGDEVWVVEATSYDEKMPEVFHGKVESISVIFKPDDKMYKGAPVPVFHLNFRDGNQRAFHLDKDFYETQLMTEKEARQLFDAYSERVKLFRDDYVKETLKRAREYVEKYGGEVSESNSKDRPVQHHD